LGSKDKINKIFAAVSLSMFSLMLSGYIVGNYSLLGFPNMMMLYALVPSFLIWFGTRKNGCGSCNQTSTVPNSQQDKDFNNNS
jgi:hypothetical protein